MAFTLSFVQHIFGQLEKCCPENEKKQKRKKKHLFVCLENVLITTMMEAAVSGGVKCASKQFSKSIMAQSTVPCTVSKSRRKRTTGWVVTDEQQF